MTKFIPTALGIIALIGASLGAVEYFAKASELQLVSLRLDQKINQDRCDWVQQRIWALDDRYDKRVMPTTVKEEYRRLKAEFKRDCER